MNRNQPKKTKSPGRAIREHCIECMGGRGSGHNYSKLISECSSHDCALYEFRFGKNPYHSLALTGEQRKRLAARARNSVLIQRAAGKSRSKTNNLG